jgi:CO/xanthine dehydrogenase FAD-binding subunit
MEGRIEGLAQSSALDHRLRAIEETLARIEASLSSAAGAGPAATEPANPTSKPRAARARKPGS